MEELAKQLINVLPYHDVSLKIEHNPHKQIYQELSYYLEVTNSDIDDWKDEIARKIALELDELWECHYYPDTPVGFIRLLAPSLSELLQFMQDLKKKDAESNLSPKEQWWKDFERDFPTAHEKFRVIMERDSFSVSIFKGHVQSTNGLYIRERFYIEADELGIILDQKDTLSEATKLCEIMGWKVKELNG